MERGAAREDVLLDLELTLAREAGGAAGRRRQKDLRVVVADFKREGRACMIEVCSRHMMDTHLEV